MQIKQLEYFLAVCEYGNLHKAASKLYTSQPNMSKVIRSLESEVGSELFNRTSKGLKLSDNGKLVYEYAKTIIKNMELIADLKPDQGPNLFNVSTCHSSLIIEMIIELYKSMPHLIIKHQQGAIEEIEMQVSQGISELGLLYVSKKQVNAFSQMLKRKNLTFVEICKQRACIFVGPNNPLYNRESISIDELFNLRYVCGNSNYFSIEDNIELINSGIINIKKLKFSMYTNSEHLSNGMLQQTDIVELGIDLNYAAHRQFDVHNLWIEGDDAFFSFGYIIQKEHVLTAAAQKLIELLKAAL